MSATASPTGAEPVNSPLITFNYMWAVFESDNELNEAGEMIGTSYQRTDTRGWICPRVQDVGRRGLKYNCRATSCTGKSRSGLYRVAEPPVPLAASYAYKSIITESGRAWGKETEHLERGQASRRPGEKRVRSGDRDGVADARSEIGQVTYLGREVLARKWTLSFEISTKFRSRGVAVSRAKEQSGRWGTKGNSFNDLEAAIQ